MAVRTTSGPATFFRSASKRSPEGRATTFVLWIASRRAIVTGDALVDFGRGFEIPAEVLQHGTSRNQVAQSLRPLLDLRVDLVLPAHGPPTDRAALERALA